MKKFVINGPRMVRNWLRLSILREFNRIVADFKGGGSHCFDPYIS